MIGMFMSLLRRREIWGGSCKGLAWRLSFCGEGFLCSCGGCAWRWKLCTVTLTE
jgi:hypothetical protein